MANDDFVRLPAAKTPDMDRYRPANGPIPAGYNGTDVEREVYVVDRRRAALHAAPAGCPASRIQSACGFVTLPVGLFDGFANPLKRFGQIERIGHAGNRSTMVRWSAAAVSGTARRLRPSWNVSIGPHPLCGASTRQILEPADSVASPLADALASSANTKATGTAVTSRTASAGSRSV